MEPASTTADSPKSKRLRAAGPEPAPGCQPLQLPKNMMAFKDTFQKPSQIYKFLREHWKAHPLFLDRTLSYVRKHRYKPAKTNCCYFHWICSNPEQTSQKTKSLGYICPWCEKDMRFLDSLMAHLKCCHPRFSFSLAEEGGHDMIEMRLNTHFNGAYCGFKYPGHDLKRDFRFVSDHPERKFTNTEIIYIKPSYRFKCNKLASVFNKRPPSNLDAQIFGNQGDEADVDVCSGRLYYHTSTCLPVKPNEVDTDSEADVDPKWLRERTQLMIEEFTDVNEGEKEVLKLWNLHIMKNYRFKSDHMMRQACLDFAEKEGATIIAKNLTKNFTLHLANLYDFGLISSGDLVDCVRMIKKLRPSPPLSNNNSVSPAKSERSRRGERNSNEHCQQSPRAKRALSNSHFN